MKDDEFGPWIAHDGRGCPPDVLGKYVHVQFGAPDQADKESFFTVDEVMASCPGWRGAEYGWRGGMVGHWRGQSFPMLWVWRYRVRKPNAMQALRDLIAEIDPVAPVEISVDALTKSSV